MCRNDLNKRYRMVEFSCTNNHVNGFSSTPHFKVVQSPISEAIFQAGNNAKCCIL